MKILNFLKKQTTILKLYQRLDTLPIWNFNQIAETQDYRYLYILKDYNELPTEKPREAIWQSIYFEYLDTVGESSENEEYRKKYLDFWELYWRQLATGDRKLLNRIEILRNQLNNLQNSFKENEKGIFEDQVMILSKFIGFHIDTRKMNAKEYFRLYKQYQKYYESLEKQHQKSLK